MADTNKYRRKHGRDDSQNKLTCFTFATDLEPCHFWGWSDAELATLHDLQAFLKVIRHRIEMAGHVSQSVGLIELYGIMHDKDTRKVWSSSDNAYVIERKYKHPHVVGKFLGRNNGLTLSALAKALGIEENMIEKPERGKYAYDNMLAYLIHAKDEDKYQYEPTEVVTELGTPYVEVWKRNKLSWEKGRAAKSKKRADVDIDWLAQEVLFGRISMRQIMADDDLFLVYGMAGNTRRIDDALRAYSMRQMENAVSAIEDGKFSTTVLFIYGAEGVGKTILARALNKYWRYVNGWGVSNAAAKNAMDDYLGQEVIWLDDVTGSAMSIGDWLKLLDSNSANNASARFHNKGQIAPRVIIINSNLKPLEFFYYASKIDKDNCSANIGRFFRRLLWYVTVIDPWELGIENCYLQHPVKVKPYVAYLPPNAQNVRYPVRDLTWDFEDAVLGISKMTVYLLAEYIVRIVDEETGGLIASRDDADELFSMVQDYVYREQQPAMSKGKYPDFDPPNKLISADTKLLNKTVQPRALLSGDTSDVEAISVEAELVETVDDIPSIFMI